MATAFYFKFTNDGRLQRRSTGWHSICASFFFFLLTSSPTTVDFNDGRQDGTASVHPFSFSFSFYMFIVYGYLHTVLVSSQIAILLKTVLIQKLTKLIFFSQYHKHTVTQLTTGDLAVSRFNSQIVHRCSITNTRQPSAHNWRSC